MIIYVNILDKKECSNIAFSISYFHLIREIFLSHLECKKKKKDKVKKKVNFVTFFFNPLRNKVFQLLKCSNVWTPPKIMNKLFENK